MAAKRDFANSLDHQKMRDMEEALSIFRALTPSQKTEFRRMLEALVADAKRSKTGEGGA